MVEPEGGHGAAPLRRDKNPPRLQQAVLLAVLALAVVLVGALFFLAA